MDVAGIAGTIGYGTIKNCYNTGAITMLGGATSSNPINYAIIAGILGTPMSVSPTTIQYCYNIGELTWAPKRPPVEGKQPVATKAFNISGGGQGGAYTGVQSPPLLSALSSAYVDGPFGYPILTWQVAGAVDNTPRTVSFAVSPDDATVAVYSDAARTLAVAAETDGSYLLAPGLYYYSVVKTGYLTVQGSVTVTTTDKRVSVTLYESAEVRISVTPVDANLSVELSGSAVEPISVAGGTYTYSLVAGQIYEYSAQASAHNGVSREFVVTDGAAISVVLTPSAHPETGGAGATSALIYGSGNPGKVNTITAGGTYYVGKGATGILTINTQAPVTLVGTGISHAAVYTDLFINCAQTSTSLTVQDIYISNITGTTNMVNYRGLNNELFFAGTSILDMNTGASGWAMVHVNSSTSLTVGGVTDEDTLYFYKREQGAGIGGNGGASGSEGQAPEYNGAITITGGNLFMKNSKQGALIGSGASANSTAFTPGDIRITGGNLNLIAISRGSAIGGAAGSSGGVGGTNVYVEGGTITINVDFSGSAIGGGGYDSGNDSDGGILHYSGGSIRTYIDYNAVYPNGLPGQSLWASLGVTEPGVSDVAITADKVNEAGESLYLLVFDTTGLTTSATTFTANVDGITLYTGGLHSYAYLNEALQKDNQISISYTIDNWVPLADPNLYLYLTGEDHALTVNGEPFIVTWDGATGAFTVAPDGDGGTTDPDPEVGAPGSGDVDGDGYVTMADVVVLMRAIAGQATLTPAQLAAADLDQDGYLTMADLILMLRGVLGL
jgi:hypothetical protein